MTAYRNPRAEAQALLDDGYEARVLEPSPPAIDAPPYFADDPTDPRGEPAGVLVVGPTPDADVSWSDYVGSHPDLAPFASERWLIPGRALPALPPNFASTRDALHQLAFFVLAPARHASTGKLGLRYTLGGFGTPFFGADRQIRVAGGELVVQEGPDAVATVPATIGQAAAAAGVEYRVDWFPDFHDPLGPADPDARLAIDPDAAAVLGDWFGFVTAVLERMRRTPGAVDVSRVQMWPEHFDPAFEMGSQDEGRRASYGASPGDGAHPEPYLYVAAWGEIDRTIGYWNDAHFNGASLSYGALRASDDPWQAAERFYRRGFEILSS